MYLSLVIVARDTSARSDKLNSLSKKTGFNAMD